MARASWSGEVTSEASVWIDQVVPEAAARRNRPHPHLGNVIIVVSLGAESDQLRAQRVTIGYEGSLCGEGGRMYGILWIVLVLAILAIAAGAVTVRSGRVAVPWLRGRVIWQRWI